MKLSGLQMSDTQTEVQQNTHLEILPSVLLHMTLIAFQVIWITLDGSQKQRSMQIVYFAFPVCWEFLCVLKEAGTTILFEECSLDFEKVWGKTGEVILLLIRRWNVSHVAYMVQLM